LCPRTFALFTLHTLLNAIICCSQLNTQGVLGWFPASGFLVIDAVGLRSMYFVVMPRVNLIVILMTYVHYLCSINCPTVICLPSICYLSYGETPLVNYGPQSNFLYIALPFYIYSHCLLFCITIILLPLDTLNPLFTANRWDWQPHRNLGAKFLVVLCAGFALLLGEDTLTSSCIWRPCPECHEASKHHLKKFGFLLLVRFNLGFITEGRLSIVLIIPSSWGSQQAVLTSH
jgi:hypothetical protein